MFSRTSEFSWITFTKLRLNNPEPRSSLIRWRPDEPRLKLQEKEEPEESQRREVLSTLSESLNFKNNGVNQSSFCMFKFVSIVFGGGENCWKSILL